uniref:Uncharacterized protein n=1 Tax=Cacopsylla melanoneura TaxID=428564 RepID=A0A8D8XHZ6_9HEMI
MPGLQQRGEGRTGGLERVKKGRPKKFGNTTKIQKPSERKAREGEKGGKAGLGRGRGRPRKIRSGDKLNLGEKKQGIKGRRGNKGRGNIDRGDIEGNCGDLKEETNIGETENIKDNSVEAVEGIVIGGKIEHPDEENNKSSDLKTETDSNTQAGEAGGKELLTSPPKMKTNRGLEESGDEVIITSQEIDTVETVDSLGNKDTIGNVLDTDIRIEEKKTEVLGTSGVVTPTTQAVTSTTLVVTPTTQVVNPTTQVVTPTSQVVTPTTQVVTPTTRVPSRVIIVRERSQRIINRGSRGEAMLKGVNSTSTKFADNIAPRKATKTKSVTKTSALESVETAKVTTQETPTKVVETFKETKSGFREKTTEKDVETLLVETKTETVSEPDSNKVEETKEMMEETNLEIEGTDEKNIELAGTSVGEMSRDETKIEVENEVKVEKREETEGGGLRGEQRRRLRKSRTPVKKT